MRKRRACTAIFFKKEKKKKSNRRVPGGRRRGGGGAEVGSLRYPWKPPFPPSSIGGSSYRRMQHSKI